MHGVSGFNANETETRHLARTRLSHFLLVTEILDRDEAEFTEIISYGAEDDVKQMKQNLTKIEQKLAVSYRDSVLDDLSISRI